MVGISFYREPSQPFAGISFLALRQVENVDPFGSNGAQFSFSFWPPLRLEEGSESVSFIQRAFRTYKSLSICHAKRLKLAENKG
jgi:hypothetical protein